VASSSEQESDSLEPNVAPDQVHLVLTRNELALVVSGLRQYGELPLVERLEQILASFPPLTVDPFQLNPAQSWLIQPAAAHQLAITFGLTVADVRADTRDVATWRGTDDDLVPALGASSTHRARPDVAAQKRAAPSKAPQRLLQHADDVRAVPAQFVPLAIARTVWVLYFLTWLNYGVRPQRWAH
jgi:hypothetical protein